MSEVYFSVGEQEIIRALQEHYEITHIEAAEKVIEQKREAAYLYSMQGQFDLAQQLLEELSEWNDDIAQDYINRGRDLPKSKKIILPGEF